MIGSKVKFLKKAHDIKTNQKQRHCLQVISLIKKLDCLSLIYER